MALAAGSVLAVYRIVGRLGAGGMGAVYRAADSKLQREVASADEEPLAWPGTRRLGGCGLKRGEIRWYRFRIPDKRRPVLILTRKMSSTG